MKMQFNIVKTLSSYTVLVKSVPMHLNHQSHKLRKYKQKKPSRMKKTEGDAKKMSKSYSNLS